MVRGVVTMERVETFSAAHRLHSNQLSDEENQKIYGKCNNPNGHGHNYVWKVKLRGIPDPETGMVYDLAELKQDMKTILDTVDHKNLDKDVEFFQIIIQLYPSTTDSLQSPKHLMIKLCCGGDNNCRNYDSVEDLYGIDCCGLQPYNNYTQLCCNGVVREKNRGGRHADMCCGTEAMRPDQTCCNGTVHNVMNGDCCGSAVYFRQEGSFLCCENNLARKLAATDMCCGSTVFDGGRQQICCGDRVFDRNQADSCCIRNNGSEVEYHSNTEFCCNGAVRKGMGLYCCYLRMNGNLVAESYQNQTHCCQFPFDIIYQKVNGDCFSQPRNV